MYRTGSNRLILRLRRTAARGIYFLLLFCTAQFVLAPAPTTGGGVQGSESEAPEQNENENQAREELIALSDSALRGSRRHAPCSVSKVDARGLAAQAERRASRRDLHVGHRLANGLLAPLRC